MQLAQWQAEGRSHHYRGNRIFYRREGRGEARDTVVLIHGFPTASWDWHRVWTDLSSDFDLIAPDMIGFGFSDKPLSYDYSLMDQTTLIESLLADLGIERVHVMAHDYGVSVAQELLARHAERSPSDRGVQLQSVLLLNGGLFPGVHRPLLIQKLLMSPLGPVLARFIGRSSLRRSFRRIFGPGTQPSEAEIGDFWSLIEHNSGQRVVHDVIQYMAERFQHGDRWVGALCSTSVPLRLVDGLADPISGADVAEHYRRTVPGADVVDLPRIGHYPQVEDPKAVVRAFREFVARTR